MSENICNFCNTVFSNKYILINHQKKAVYCLKIQNRPVIKCNYCNKICKSQQLLLNHENCCFEKKDTELKETEKKLNESLNTIIKLKQTTIDLKNQNEYHSEQIKDLNRIIERLSMKAIDKHTINTTTNNLNIISPIDFNNIERIKDIINDDYNINYVINGQKGLAQFVVDNLLKDKNGDLMYVCTDPSRQIFKYKDISGELKKDVEAKKLTNYIVDGGIKKKTVDVSNKWFTNDEGKIDMDKFNIMIEKQQNILKLDGDNTGFKKELVSITTK